MGGGRRPNERGSQTIEWLALGTGLLIVLVSLSVYIIKGNGSTPPPIDQVGNAIVNAVDSIIGALGSA